MMGENDVDRMAVGAGRHGPSFARGPRAPGAGRVVAGGVILLSLFLAVGPLIPEVSASAPSSALAGGRSPGAPQPAADLAASVSWNGVPVSQAASAATAFPIGPGDIVDVVFNFTEPRGGASVVNASLVLRYLDVTLSTESIAPTNTSGFGVGQLNWTFGSLIYVTEGVYEVDAQLADTNGVVVFNEPFYVDARAPLVLGSAVALFATVLGAAEAYWIATLVRSRTARRRRYRPR